MVLASFLFLSCSLSPEQDALVRSFTLPDLSLKKMPHMFWTVAANHHLRHS